MRTFFAMLGSSKMSHEENFQDSTGVSQVLLVIVAMLAFPLLPMLMGWFTMLR